MAQITDPEAIKFINERIRPLAADLRALLYESDEFMALWFGGMNAKIPNNSDTVEDGRETEGVSRLVGTDVVSLVTQIAALNTALNAAGVPLVISKPCVTAISVQ